MRMAVVAAALVSTVLVTPAVRGPVDAASAPPCPDRAHPGTKHADPNLHRHSCAFKKLGTIAVSRTGGLGQVEVHGDLAAVVQRDEGAVALVDLSKPARPKVLGRYEDDAQRSLDGDVAFSDDGRWLFYARQTEQFSLDGVHVVDVSDPSAPRLAFYQPQGGTFRIAYYSDANGEWVISLDAIHGLVINRFEPTTGALVPVHVDPMPALERVGGPASAGLFVDRSDAATDTPLLYATSGTSGLAVYDISLPAAPELVGAWEEQGLADVEVVATGKRRTIYVATEYWFDANTRPEIVELDATDLQNIRARRRLSGGGADDLWRFQGLDIAHGTLFASHSHAGVEAWGLGSPRLIGAYAVGAKVNAASRQQASPYAMDVEAHRGHILVSDAGSGILSVLCHRNC